MGTAPAWKQLYDDSQTSYYVDADTLPKSGPSDVTTMLEYKIPQVIGGAQVWSIVTHMRVNCDGNQMVTRDNTLYASKMGAGPVVQSQPANDNWHAPLPGTLGGLVWGAACPKR
ncbi:MAG TPA: surface-adhesin E family protein [Caulobacteraceae bacterium]|nr:surface-adhesin E family protein [Caulobacteraceae bacterium]